MDLSRSERSWHSRAENQTRRNYCRVNTPPPAGIEKKSTAHIVGGGKACDLARELAQMIPLKRL